MTMINRKSRTTRAAGPALFLALILAALAASAPGGDRRSTQHSAASGPRTSTGMMGAAYLTIKGTGTTDRLVAASAPTSVAKNTELHKTVMGSGGMMSMKPVKSIAIPATGTVTLKPGGYHVMLINLKKPLVAGARFPLTLTFAKSGEDHQRDGAQELTCAATAPSCWSSRPPLRRLVRHLSLHCSRPS